MLFLWCRGCARKGWQFLKEEWHKFIKGFIKKLTWDKAQFFSYIVSYVVPLKFSCCFALSAGMLFTKRNKNRTWSQVIKKLLLLQSYYLLQTLIEHCLPLLFCQRVHLKKLTRKTCRTFFQFGLPVVSHVNVYLYTINSLLSPHSLPNKPLPIFKGRKLLSPPPPFFRGRKLLSPHFLLSLHSPPLPLYS